MRNCLAILGVILILILVVSGILIYLDTISPMGIVIDGTLFIPEPPPLQATPFPETPTLTVPPTTTPAPTPIPDPVAYRTRVLLRARHFATTLNAFMEVNERVQENPGLFDDPDWRSKVRTTLDEFDAAARELSTIEPVPPEYQAIDEAIKLVSPEVANLEENYLRGLETGDEQHFRAVSENMNRIFEYLTQAQILMAEAGWDP